MAIINTFHILVESQETKKAVLSCKNVVKAYSTFLSYTPTKLVFATLIFDHLKRFDALLYYFEIHSLFCILVQALSSVPVTSLLQSLNHQQTVFFKEADLGFHFWH